MRRGSYDTSIYDLVVKAVSTQIDESFNYTKSVKAKLKITEEYNTINQITHIDYLLIRCNLSIFRSDG